MMWRVAWAILILVLLACVPASAQINDARPFSAEYGFSDPADPNLDTIVSGTLEATLHDTRSPFAFFETEGMGIHDLDEVCWGDADGQGGSCVQQDGLQVVVHDGGAAGLKFPLDVSGSFTAAHALGMFMRFEGEDVNSLDLEQGLLAPSVDGRMVFDPIGHIGDIQFIVGGFRTPPATLAPASQHTVIDVRAADGQLIHRLQGKDEIVYFSGTPEIPPFHSPFAILPFEDRSEARFTPASAAAAKEGIDFERINTLFKNLQESNREDQQDPGEANVTAGSGAVEQLLQEVLNGAVVRFPQAENITLERFEEEFALILFDSLVVENRGGALAWSGQAAMDYREGQVSGAQTLFGVWLFKLPWWGYLLWAIAIGAFVARLVIKPPKTHPVWDKYRWIGWVAGAVLFLLVAFLWDLEMQAVWGTSVLTTNASGTAFWVTFGIQMATMSLVLGVVAAPLSIIIKNGLMLGRQGTFMHLAGPSAFLLSYLIGATLLLAYLELILDTLVAGLGD